MGRQANLLG